MQPCNINFLTVPLILFLAWENDAFEEENSHKIWHSYIFNSGAGNREGLTFYDFKLSWFSAQKNILKWEAVEDQNGVSVIGLGKNVLLLTSVDLKNSSSSMKIDFNSELHDIITFKKWDPRSQKMESYAIIAGCETDTICFLKWYHILDKKLVFFWDWPFNKNITNIHVIMYKDEMRLLIVGNSQTTHYKSSADIYSFAIDGGLQLWLYDRVLLKYNPSYIALCNCNDEIYLAFAFPEINKIYIYKSLSSLPGHKHFQLYEKLVSEQFFSMKAFHIGLNCYLMVAGLNTSIYKLRGGAGMTVVSTTNFGHWNDLFVTPINKFRDEILLFVKREDNTDLILWSEKREYQLQGNLSNLICKTDYICKEVKQFSVRSAVSFQFNEVQNIVFTSTIGDSKMLIFSAVTKPIFDAVDYGLQEILDYQTLLENQFNDQELKMKMFDDIVLNISDEFDSHMYWKLKHVECNLTTVTPKPNGTINMFEFALNEKWAEEDYSIYRDLIMKRDLEFVISDTLTQIDKIFNGFEVIHAVENAPLPNIIDAITFLGNVDVTRLDLSYINGVDVNDMLQNSYMLGSNRKIGGVKIVTDIHVDNISFEKLGAISACDIIFANELQENNNIINGDIVYENEVAILGDFSLLAEDGDDMDINLHQSKYGFSYNGKIMFDHLFISKDSIIEESINGRPIIVPVHNSFDIHTLDKVNQARVERINVDNILSVSFINDRNFTSFFRQLKEKSLISVDKHSLGNDVTGKGFVTGDIAAEYLNGIKFPESFVMVNEEDIPMISAYKNFTNHLIVTHMWSEDQDVKYNYNRSDSDILNIFVTGNAKFEGIILTNSINNHTMKKFLDVVKQNEQNIEITGQKYFTRFESLGELQVKGKLNFLYDENLVLKNLSEERLISSPRFEQIEFERLDIFGTWDGINVATLNESMVRVSKSGKYESNLIFGNDLTLNISRLVVSSCINDFAIPDETHKEYMIFLEDLKLEQIKAVDFIINGSLTSHQINKYNITEFNLKRMSVSQPQVISRNFDGASLKMNGNLKLRSNISSRASPDEEDLNSVLEYVTKNTGSSPTCLKVVGHIRTVKGINGIDLMNIAKKVASLSKPNAFHHKVVFNDSVTFSRLKINGHLQKLNLKRLNQDLIYTPSYVLLKGSKNFINNLTVINNMKVTSLNGYLIPRILTKKGDYSIKESIIINGDVLIVGNVTSYSAINNCSTSDMFRKYSAVQDSYIIMNDIFLQTVVVDHLIIDGSIRNRSFNSLIGDVVFVNEKSDITAKKVFDGIVNFEGDIVVEESFNGLNLSLFFGDIVFIDSEMELEGDLIMRKAIVEHMEINNCFNATLINGFYLNDWFEESIPLYQNVNIDGKKKIRNPICYNNIAVNFINGHLAISIIPLMKKQFIPNFSYFPKLDSISNISVERWVNGKNLNQELEDTILTDGNQKVYGRILFSEDMIVNNNVTLEYANGREMSRVASLYTDQLISSVIIFQDKVVANREINKLNYINDIDIKNWNQRSIKLDESQVIGSSWTVRGNASIRKYVEGNGLLGDSSLINVQKSVDIMKTVTSEIQEKIQEGFREHCEKVMNFSSKISLQPNIFYQIEISQILKASSPIESLITFRSGQNHHLILTFFNECLSVLYVWNKMLSKFVFLNHINIGPIQKWITLYNKNATFLVTTASNHSTCEENSRRGNVWIFDGNQDKYGHVLATEGFADMAKTDEFSPDKFYTIGYKGEVYEWHLGPEITRKLVVELGDEYRFLGFNVLEELAFTNGREIRNAQNELLHTFVKTVHRQIAVTRIRGRKLVAVPYYDEIVVYENLLENKIFSVVAASKVGSVEWFSSGSGQKLLLYETQQKFINLIEFKGASSQLKKISVPISIHNIMLFTLHYENDYLDRQFFFFWQSKKILLLEASYLGNLYKEEKTDIC